ncbi:MAG: transposase [Limnothrix sp.]
MSRNPRILKNNCCYHITVRCNNRDFHLSRRQCRNLFLYAIRKCKLKYDFKLYALCIMSNHVHYLLEPSQAHELPKLMHWLNWYTAMCFNRMLKRSGHFWEKRYHSSAFPLADKQRALNTLRYIHANPKAAGMQQGFFYDFSNYGSYDRLMDDGLSDWHPAFLALGTSLDICAAIYRDFCKKYRPKSKPERKYYWGTKLLAQFANLKYSGSGRRKRRRKTSPGQLSLWDD